VKLRKSAGTYDTIFSKHKESKKNLKGDAMKRHLMFCFIALQIISISLVSISNPYQQKSFHDGKVYPLSTHKHHHNHNNIEHKHGHSHTVNTIDYFIQVANIIDIVDCDRKNYYYLKQWLINPSSKELFRPPIA
jgi:hypothetical protein